MATANVVLISQYTLARFIYKDGRTEYHSVFLPLRPYWILMIPPPDDPRSLLREPEVIDVRRGTEKIFKLRHRKPFEFAYLEDK